MVEVWSSDSLEETVGNDRRNTRRDYGKLTGLSCSIYNIQGEGKRSRDKLALAKNSSKTTLSEGFPYGLA